MNARLFFLPLLLLVFPVLAQQATLFPVQIKGKWGYTNKEGQLTIKAVYDYAENFHEGLAVVALANQPCVIDVTNKRIVDTGLYANIQRFSEGLAKVTDFNQQSHFINAYGKIVFTLPADIYDARPFKMGLSCVSKSVDLHETKFQHDIVTAGYKFGYVNTKGVLTIPVKFDDADDFEYGLARFRDYKRFGLIDTLGNIVVNAIYSNIGRFFEGKAVVDKGGSYGYINLQGVEVIVPTYQYCYDFSEGMAGFRMNNKYGFLNEEGKIAIEAQYDAIRPFSQGLAAVKLNGKWGFINKSGKLVLRHVFDDATIFVDDRCPVLVKRKWGFIDQTGVLVIPADFDAVGTFSHGLAEVMIGNTGVFVNKGGMLLPILK